MFQANWIKFNHLAQPAYLTMSAKPTNELPSKDVISNLVAQCLEEDVKTGDLTARLTPEKSEIDGKIISRETGIVCGKAWVDEVFNQIDANIEIDWKVDDGDTVSENQTLCRFEGYARPILTGERSALNIMQTLSGTASITNEYVKAIAHTKAKLLDTRKTLPSMREAQKYAVLCGGGYNHRMGLYDGIIIKENHLRSGKSLEQIVKDAIGSVPEGTLVELEVENLDELKRGLDAGAKRIMLDDFTLADMCTAVKLTGEQADLEASGNVSLKTIQNSTQNGKSQATSGC